MPAASRRKRPNPQLKQPVQERSRFTVAAILEAAVQVFEEHGHAAGTTARIADRAGISVGSLYQYFPNKDAILVALAERHLDDAEAQARRLLDAAAGGDRWPLELLLEALVAAFLALHQQHPGLHRLLYEGGLLPEQTRERLRQLERRYGEELAQVLARHPEVRRDDAELQAWFVIQMLEHFTHRLVLEPPARKLRPAVAGELKTVLLRYLKG
ncbi:TetR family transcriptional regulator [Solimonas fluminis]|uniref:TetR family transcriptional regulator n=1 Tax=Solimonas fluminis TaxID=2086571 RepID=A0A2S5TFG5_9GAMM|nr:TetR/AcrR family transcriptional regulator [Solimonas fluminis]PPE73568.1 TetR family transcriptional regulator [Solimonas fluminis]